MKTISKENRKPVRAGYLEVGDVISYFDMANPYQEWTIIETKPCKFWGKIAKIKSLIGGHEQTCFSPISFKKDSYAGWKFVKAGQNPASDSIESKGGNQDDI